MALERGICSSRSSPSSLGLWQPEFPKPCLTVPGDRIPVFGVPYRKYAPSYPPSRTLVPPQPETESNLPTSMLENILLSPFSVKFSGPSASQKDEPDWDLLPFTIRSSPLTPLPEEKASSLPDNLFDHEDPWNTIGTILGLQPTRNTVPEIADPIAAPSYAPEAPMTDDQNLVNYGPGLSTSKSSYAQPSAGATHNRFFEELHIRAHGGPNTNDAPQATGSDFDTLRQGSVTQDGMPHAQVSTESASVSKVVSDQDDCSHSLRSYHPLHSLISFSNNPNTQLIPRSRRMI